MKKTILHLVTELIITKNIGELPSLTKENFQLMKGMVMASGLEMRAPLWKKQKKILALSTD